MKLIDPHRDARVQALEDENSSLKQRIAELEIENQSFRRQSGKLKSRAGSVVSTTSLTADRGYLRDTKSSKGRTSSVVSSLQPLVDAPRPERDQQGKLVVPAKTREPSFLKPTASSAGKINAVVPVTDELELVSPQETATFDWSSDRSADIPEAPCPTDCSCSTCTSITIAATQTQSLDSLTSTTRLLDRDFYSTPPSHVPLPFKRQTHYLRSPYSIAQDTLWTALLHHWPQTLRHYYLEGPSTILFGVGDLEQCFGTPENPSENAGLCGKPPAAVGCAIQDVVRLRNALAHQRPKSCKEIDNLMEKAQALAVTLLDKKRAEKVRRFRDQMQREVQREYEKIVKYEPVMHLPGAKRVPIHHQLLFLEVCARSNGGGEYVRNVVMREYGEVVVRAARAWEVRCGEIGADDPRRLSAFERKRTQANQRQQTLLTPDEPVTASDMRQPPAIDAQDDEEPASYSWNAVDRTYNPNPDGW